MDMNALRISPPWWISACRKPYLVSDASTLSAQDLPEALATLREIVRRRYAARGGLPYELRAI